MESRIMLSKLTAVFLAMALASVASAQVTSSSARGTITDADGAPIANATVIITHEPSGSVKTATTGANGHYFQPGLRIGGPYSVAVTASGYRARKIDEIFLSPGTQAPLDLAMDPTTEVMEEIIVSAVATSVRDLNNGVGSTFSAADIGNTPSGVRDIMSTIMRDPLAQSQEEGNLSVAGTNPRFNGFAIDGALQTDDFGLENNNGEGVYVSTATVRSPINLDAVESATLVASDYDVTTQGFTGGLVSVTTKSGTNDWDGSAFYYWQNDSMFGNKLADNQTFDPGSVDEKEYGFTLGGPIIDDKLFFFVSYDEFESALTNDYTNNDVQNDIAPGFFDALRPIIQSSLGYDPGTRPTVANTPVTSERTLVKLDWNISDLHRTSFTYQSSEEFGTNASPTSFETAWYDVPVDLKAYTLQLYSDWNDSLSTTLRANLKEFDRGQNCRAGRVVGQIEVENLEIADVVGTPLEGLILAGDDVPDIIAGCDRFRHANDYNDRRLQIFAKADYFIGDHVVTAGLEYEDFSLFNLFVPQALGRFQYDDYFDLLTAEADVNYQNVPSNNSNDAAASWGYEKLTLFVQDTIQLTADLEIGFGLRYEKYDQSDAPVFVQNVQDTYGIDSTSNLDGKDLVLPRVSFRWTPTDRTTLSGGFGKFSGGDPKVWTSNSFNLPSVFTQGFDIVGADPTVIPQSLLDNVAAGIPVPTDVIAPNFEIPSDWKASLRLEQDLDLGPLGDGYIITAQYLYTQTVDGFLWTNLAQTSRADTTPGVAPDGRPIYADLDDLGIDNLTQLGNHSEGESHVIALALGKRYDYGLDFNLSYAFQDAEIVTEGTSSRGVSNWRGIIGADRNSPTPRPSPFQIEHSFKLNLGYEKDFFGTGDSMTRIDVFARRFSGDALAHTFNVSSGNPLFGRARGESPFDTDALYVPTSATDSAVVYASGFDQAAFNQYVAANVKGTGIITPFTSNASWTTAMDIRIQQSIPGLPFLGNLLGDNNFKLVLNIDNFLNLLNDDWGRWADGPFFLDNDIVTADLVTVADVAANGVDGASALFGDAPRLACQSQSDCVYRFNSFRDREFTFTNRRKSVYRIRLAVRFEF